MTNFEEVNRDVSREVNRNVRKVGVLESPKVDFFRKFYSKRWSFERWRRAILLLEPGELFLPQFKRRFVVSGAQNIHKNSLFVRKGATSVLNFGVENLRFRHRMWSNETAVKQRKKTIFEPLREEPQ